MKKNSLKIAISKIKFGFALVAGLALFTVACEKENLDNLVPTNTTESAIKPDGRNPILSNGTMTGGGDEIFPITTPVIFE